MSKNSKYVQQPKNYSKVNVVKYKRNIFSQHGEDGIIEFLLSKLSATDRWCCEFGAWDGKHLSNTFNLIKNKNYKAVLIESDKDKFKDLQKTQQQFKTQITALNKRIHYLKGEKCMLDSVLSSTDLPKDFDVLSVDVDGPDYHIWKSLIKYRPKIVIIEHSGIDDYIIQREGATHKKDIDGSTSFHPMVELGKEKGYVLICDTGNLIFLDKRFKL